MKAVPLELKDANAYVEKYHRHHKAVSRDKFRVGCEENGELDKDDCGGGTWSSPSRPRELTQITLFGTEQKYPTERKQRWVKHL